ncbi:MAG: hypothetical protein HKO55_09595 [Gammaproteobacteria bacterium]|nr:hypothetical protein [Gammaproteobacteria bacterium]NNM21511.1 hypothetical protein [Gammaproteobacteria bacterium]
MVSLLSLWMPVLIAAALCWIAGAILWTALPLHKSDYARVDNEEAARDALRSLSAGQYNIPHIADPSKLSDDDKQKFADGPVAFITVLDKGMPNMGKNLVIQFIFYTVVSALVGYVAAASLPAGAAYLAVFQVVGMTAWLAYGAAALQDCIWFGRPWSTAFKSVFDALVYALLTAGVFGWLWP